ncbi:MAG TPA: hypothetical protein V6D50_15575 [Chroococcales cyanobacterium]
MNIPHQVQQAIITFLATRFKAAALDNTQFSVNVEGDESKPFYIAWIKRSTEQLDPETGRLATFLTWAKFSYMDNQLTLLTSSWELTMLLRN